MNWLDNITREDLHENYQEMIDVLASICDEQKRPVHTDQEIVHIILTLAKHYSSQAFYFRSIKEIESDRKKQYILSHFNGENQPELARRTGFGITYVYEILAEDRNKKQLSFLA